jgi:hypothetical protein
VVSPTNLALFRDSVRARCGISDGDAFFADSDVDDMVNEALQVISSEADWPWLQAATTFSTVSGTQGYTPPSDWSVTRVLSIDGYKPLEWRSLPEIRGVETTFTSRPTAFTTNAETILLAPVPDGAYTVRHDYSVSESDLVSDTDEPLLPAQFHFAVVAKAAELMHLRQRDTQRAAAQMTEYTTWLTRMRRHMARSSAPKRVRSYGARTDVY